MASLPDVIPNAELRLEHIPRADAPWDPNLQMFDLTFGGYAYWESFEKCAQVANQFELTTHTELRTALFFFQRSLTFAEEDPDDRAMEEIRDLVERIRAKVAAGELD